MTVTVTSTPYDVSVSDDGSLVTVAATGPAGPSGASFIPAADSGTGTSVSSTLSIVGGTNVTTSVDGTTITVNSSGASGTVTSVTGTSPIVSSGGTTPAISLANTSVTPAEYAVGKFTVDQQGRITAASSSLSTEVSALFDSDVAALLDATTKAGMRSALGVKNHATIEADTTPQYFENLVESNDTQEFITNSGLTNYLAQTSQNLADLNSSTTALTNLGGTTVGKAVFAATDAAAARTAIGAGTGSGDGDVVAANNLSDLANAGTARTNLGATTVGANVFTAADQAAARSAIGVGTGTGDVVAANNLSDLADAATARTNLGLGTAATSATGDFEASGSITTHNAITTAHGISSFGATLVDDADATAARATLQAAASNHEHSGSQITSGVVADDYVDLRPDMGATFDGQGSAVQGSKTVLVPVERPGVITAAALVGDAIGSITIDVKRYTPTGLGTLGSSTTMGSISLTSRQHIRDTTLSGWTTSVSAGDVLSFATSGTIATVTRVTVKVKIEDS